MRQQLASKCCYLLYQLVCLHPHTSLFIYVIVVQDSSSCVWGLAFQFVSDQSYEVLETVRLPWVTTRVHRHSGSGILLFIVSIICPLEGYDSHRTGL